MTDQGPRFRDLETIASAFQQSPTITIVLDGPQLRIVGWNAAGERFLKPILGDLGACVWQADWIERTGAYEPLRRVLKTGEPFVSRGWPLTGLDASGQLREIYLDFTYTPWRRADGSIRGIIGTANDVSEASRRQWAVEASAASWQQRFEVSRDALIALQTALLPATVPVVPRLRIAARYLLADVDTAAGGDWFSAYPTTAGRVALVVGDVVGHGVAASATMGQLRAVIKERLRSGVSLASAMEALDEHATTVPDADATTVCVALMNPLTGELEYCTAGHPAPLLVHGRSRRYLDTTGAGPLGSGRPFTTLRVLVPDDALLLLYSDGLIERPGIDRTASVQEVAQVVTDALNGIPNLPDASRDPADRVCELSLDLLTRTGLADDITVLAVHRIPPVADLAARLAGHPESVNLAVDRIDGWLDTVGAGRSDRLHLRHAVLEIVANSVEHGFAATSQDDGVIDLSARLADNGEAVIDLADNGQWKEPTDGGGVRGLGLPLARQLLDTLTVRHDHTGTRIRITHRLSRPAPIVTTPAHPATPSDLPSLDEYLEMHTEADDPDTLMVRGALLSTTAERLRTRLDVATHAGTRSLIVNLDDVTHLTSAAVRVLQQAQRAADRQERQVVLAARPGTVAHEVLNLLGILVDHGGKPG